MRSHGLSSLVLVLASLLSAAPQASAQEQVQYDKLDSGDLWEGFYMVVDYGLHGGIKPGGGYSTDGTLSYGKVKDTSLNMRVGMRSWPARDAFTEGSTVFGQPVGYQVEFYGGVYGLFGDVDNGSEDLYTPFGLVIDILYPVIQAQSFAVMASFQGGFSSDSLYDAARFGPGLQGLYQLSMLRLMAEYRYLPFWIGDNGLTHDLRARVHLQLGETFYLGVYGGLNYTQLRTFQGGYTMDTISFGLEMGG